MVGVNTVIKDDPLLLSRIPGGREPARVIIDSDFRAPRKARIFSTADIAPLYIATTKRGAKGPHILTVKGDHGKCDLEDLLKKLGKMGMIRVLVEGGGGLVAGLIEKKLVDEFLFFIAPKIIGGKDAVTSVEGAGIRQMNQALILNKMKIRKFRKDILIEAEVG